VGVHPHEAREFAGQAEEVRALLEEDKVVAVGEIGLDFYRDLAPREVQLDALREQLRWAEEKQLPVSLHNREADATLMPLLRQASVTVVLHCFGGGESLAREAVAAGHFISFAGNLTFPRAEGLRQLARSLPEDR